MTGPLHPTQIRRPTSKSDLQKPPHPLLAHLLPIPKTLLTTLILVIFRCYVQFSLYFNSSLVSIRHSCIVCIYPGCQQTPWIFLLHSLKVLVTFPLSHVQPTSSTPQFNSTNLLDFKSFPWYPISFYRIEIDGFSLIVANPALLIFETTTFVLIRKKKPGYTIGEMRVVMMLLLKSD